MTIEEHKKLAPLTTFRIGGEARYFARATNLSELKEAVVFAKEKKLPVFILGGGSNILMSDEGFPGLVISVALLGVSFRKISEDDVLVEAFAGEDWDSFVEESVKRGYGGLENLSFIPGNVGGAPIQNIGAYGVEVKDAIQEVSAFNMETLRVEHFSNEQCQFSYRNSFFKTPLGKQYIVVSVIFKLSQKSSPQIAYKDLEVRFKESKEVPTFENIREVVIAIRKGKLPDHRIIGTAGSFFKNPTVRKEIFEKLQEQLGEIPNYPSKDGGIKIPAGWLLDSLGHFKGKNFGNVGVFEKQALVLVNNGGASASEVLEVAEIMKNKIFEMTGIILEREVVYVK